MFGRGILACLWIHSESVDGTTPKISVSVNPVRRDYRNNYRACTRSSLNHESSSLAACVRTRPLREGSAVDVGVHGIRYAANV